MTGINPILDLVFGGVAFVFLVLLIVGVHEGGHFLVAKAVGIRVLEFNIGFGQKLLSHTWGGTLYALRAIPLGGYVLLHGMSRPARLPWVSEQASQTLLEKTGGAREVLPAEDPGDQSGAYLSKAVWKRALVIIAGPLFNLLLAWAIISVDVSLGDAGRIAAVDPRGGAAAAGIVAGDSITAIDGHRIEYSNQIFAAVTGARGPTVRVDYLHAGQARSAVVTSQYDPTYHRERLGLALAKVHLAPGDAVARGATDTVAVLAATSDGLYRLVSGQIPGGVTGKEGLTGMVGVVGFTNEAAHAGPDPYAIWIAFFSIQLALINLVPLPVLDGGRLVLLALEAVRRRPLDPARELIINYVGLAVILGLALLINLNDVRKLVFPH